MYRCKDCNKEYLNKPDYCDCGNNVFEEVSNLPEFEIDKMTFRKNSSENPDETSAKTFFEQYPKLKEIKDSMDVISTSIFGICLILAILPWIFWGNSSSGVSTTKKPPHHVQKHVSQANIPDIDSLWNDSVPVQKKIEVTQMAQVPPPEAEPAPEPVGQQLRQPMPFSQPTHVTAPIHVDKNVQHKVAAKPVVNQHNTVASSGAMADYKNSLRRVLFAHLAVTSVQGIGKCQVEFSVDRNGRLLNRKFSRLSDNRSLNDAVYNMLMSVPQYSPPPAGYNGEKIRLSFAFDNGYYEVSY